jgi:hypothetical protein
MSIDDKVRVAAVAIKAADALLVRAVAGTGVDCGLPPVATRNGLTRPRPEARG